ncbi:Zinc finger and BTB domain-containing protein 41 [Eumeta japonica]|uniref:Zinc finger and BTB domain-containing protein 41 n=1 Tax=Eumeta variegata TaxID=151549 RepID=A0A4C1TGC5_EUMVA|nr:Zinc finger and BTB domain-containing protein 41 [Eumeta japonica]
MEQDVDNNFGSLCSTCLSGDRNLMIINSSNQVYQIFRLIMYDFAGDKLVKSLSDVQHVCWECLALMQRFNRFKKQVHNAQEHLRVLALSRGQEGVDLSHSYMSQSLSSLDSMTKVSYDKVYVDYTNQTPWSEHEYVLPEPIEDDNNIKNEEYAQTVRETVHVDPIDTQLLGVPEIVLQNPVTGNVSHILIREDMSNNLILETQPAEQYIVTTDQVRLNPESAKEDDYKTIEIGITAIGNTNKTETVITSSKEGSSATGYTTEYMTEEDLAETREKAKSKPQYASAAYKCELCIIGFYTQQQVEDHFLALHRFKPGLIACKICYVYVDSKRLESHHTQHYLRYRCKLCDHLEYSAKLMATHVKKHMTQSVSNSVIKIGDSTGKTKGRKKKEQPIDRMQPGNLRKLLSKKTIEGYQCLECDMFFTNSRARKNHVQRFHREGLQCDHCKKFFVNRTTLATHLKLHEGPLPRSECPICHKMVRTIQLKYHIQRHQTRGRYECTDCNKVFSHLATYHAHLKYSRAHASDDVFKSTCKENKQIWDANEARIPKLASHTTLDIHQKLIENVARFPCPMCNKGYPTKEAMQDHFNYQHLCKTAHKCPICDKPIATRVNVEKHMARVHGEKKEKPRNHMCRHCGKAFTDKKALQQHEVIHSGERPLVCDVCQQTFKQKASLYTHKKRVHKIFPMKKVVEFMDTKP